jgi:hypothetical protein
MAKKAMAKSSSRSAKATMDKRGKDVAIEPKKKAAFGKRSKASSMAHTMSQKPATSKTKAKPARKSTIGKAVQTAVGAVSSTVSSVAGQATSLLRRGRAEKTR